MYSLEDATSNPTSLPKHSNGTNPLRDVSRCTHCDGLGTFYVVDGCDVHEETCSQCDGVGFVIHPLANPTHALSRALLMLDGNDAVGDELEYDERYDHGHHDEGDAGCDWSSLSFSSDDIPFD